MKVYHFLGLAVLSFCALFAGLALTAPTAEAATADQVFELSLTENAEALLEEKLLFAEIVHRGCVPGTPQQPFGLLYGDCWKKINNTVRECEDTFFGHCGIAYQNCVDETVYVYEDDKLEEFYPCGTNMTAITLWQPDTMTWSLTVVVE